MDEPVREFLFKKTRRAAECQAEHRGTVTAFFRRLLTPPDNIEPRFRRFFVVTNYGCIYAVLSHAVMAAAFVLGRAWALAAFNVFSTLLYVGAFVINRQGRHLATLLLFLFEVTGVTGMCVWYFGATPGFAQFLVLLALLTSFYPAKEKHLLPLVVAVLAGVFLAYHFFSRGHPAVLPLPPWMEDGLYVFSSLLFFALLVLAGFFYSGAATRAEAALAEEHARSEALLQNILPASIARRLKDNPGLVADRFAETSIVFADIVGFTPFSQRIRPEDLVGFLNQVVSRFDDLTAKHGMEKIKTIGDAYMVVAGLPEPRADHARAAAEMALDMQRSVGELSFDDGAALSMRIGIHSGPVVAGVIGKSKFIYDLWGDTVNTASRMESHCLPGRIQVTSGFRDLLGDDYLCEERGEVQIKGKGMMTTYFLEGRKGQARSET
ncbi:MAG: adenylate/guanylate cyclase domain-containing protein [Proteobacteria bacterium]|nr:adenylate/guanylate cyclase domain-containing protein [Pseudomonadota bacterium]